MVTDGNGFAAGRPAPGLIVVGTTSLSFMYSKCFPCKFHRSHFVCSKDLSTAVTHVICSCLRLRPSGHAPSWRTAASTHPHATRPGSDSLEAVISQRTCAQGLCVLGLYRGARVRFPDGRKLSPVRLRQVAGSILAAGTRSLPHHSRGQFTPLIPTSFCDHTNIHT